MILKKNVSLAPFNTFGVQAYAHQLATIRSTEDLLRFIPLYQVPFIMGGGSNILLTRDIDFLLLKNEIMGRKILSIDDHEVRLQIGSGENWHAVVSWAVKQGWGGIENLSLIPGTVGAAPVQNIGAYGTELKDVVVEVEAVDLTSGQIEQFSKEDCQFGYRDSIFKHDLYKEKYFISQVTLRLSTRPVPNTKYADIEKKLSEQNLPHPTIQDIHRIVMEVREFKLPDPVVIGNAGSFFKNPLISKGHFEQLKLDHPGLPGYPAGDMIKVPAGWLIDRAGWKGKSIGRVGCYEKQALVIVNRGGATGQEILDFSKLIQADIVEKYNVQLTPEINIW